MGPHRHGRGKLRAVLAASVLAGGSISGAAERAPASVPGTSFNVRIRHRQTELAVMWALRGASQRLGEARCQGVLSDFSDASGRPLRQVLEGLGQTAPDYLGSMLFYDGAKQLRCARDGVVAGTSPGSRVIFICPDAFRALHRADKAAAEVIIIHELLHSLGLGEDPPSSWRITQAVYRRCR
jgi:hypothetical protein